MRTSNIIAFSIGAAIGSVVTWKVLKTKYEQIAQEEINSVKEIFSVRKENVEEKTLESEVEESDEEDDESDEKAYKKIVSHYTNDDEYFEEPYVIMPEHFGELESYDTINCTFYNDGVLVNDSDDEPLNIDTTVGYECLKHFGQYEDGFVFVRNDTLKRDYEVSLSSKNYSDVVDD